MTDWYINTLPRLHKNLRDQIESHVRETIAQLIGPQENNVVSHLIDEYIDDQANRVITQMDKPTDQYCNVFDSIESDPYAIVEDEYRAYIEEYSTVYDDDFLDLL
jgi:hypothetical protein